MFTIGRQALSQTLFSNLSANLPISLLDWNIKLFHKSGGLKRQWFWGADNVPFKSIEFELNKKLMGAGSMELLYLDFPIHAGDYIEIYFQGSLKYKALVESSTDPTGGKINLIPFSQQFQELLINNTFTAQTISQMFQTIIEALDSDTGILWHSFYVDTNNTDTYAIDYSKYEQPKKVFDDLVKECDDREWGVNQHNIFSVYEMESTVSKNLLNTDTPYFESVTEDTDYSGIKTRYQVEAKVSGAAEVARIGEVGYGGSYPILTDIESKVRKQVDKYQVSEVITDANEALDIAYADLVYQAQIKNPITCKGGNPNLYFPVIGQRIKTESGTEKIMKVICNCDSVQGWSGYPSLTTSYYTEGAGAICFSGLASPTGIVYDFGEQKRFLSPEKIGFMIRSTIAGDYLEFSTAQYKNGTHGSGIHGVGVHGVGAAVGSDYLWETSKTIRISTSSVWQYVEFSLTDTDFRYIGFRFNGTPALVPATIYIDEIQLYTYTKKTHEGNIVNAKFKFDANGIKYNLNLNDYNKFANDASFYYEKKIKKLETIANGD